MAAGGGRQKRKRRMKAVGEREEDIVWGGQDVATIKKVMGSI